MKCSAWSVDYVGFSIHLSLGVIRLVGRGLGSRYLGLTCLASEEPPVFEQEGGGLQSDLAPGPTLVTTVVGLRGSQGLQPESVVPQLPVDSLHPGLGALEQSQSPRAQEDAHRKGLEPGREGGRQAHAATAASQVTGGLKPGSVLSAALEGWHVSGQKAHSGKSAITTTLT